MSDDWAPARCPRCRGRAVQETSVSGRCERWCEACVWMTDGAARLFEAQHDHSRRMRLQACEEYGHQWYARGGYCLRCNASSDEPVRAPRPWLQGRNPHVMSHELREAVRDAG